jgi:hypothetical protein
MGKYFVGFSAFGTTTANKTSTKIIGASAKKFEAIEHEASGAGTVSPADVQHQAKAAFLSNAGAGTPGASPTPEKMDQASNASLLTAGVSYSAEPTTYNTNVFTLFSFNQRGGMRWSVPRGEGFMSDGGQTGLSFASLIISSTAGSVDGQTMWWEP